MFEITITGSSPQELRANMFEFLGLDKEPAPEQPKATSRKPKAATPEPDPEPTGEDAAVLADLKAPVEPMPETAKAVVDAGTGEPAAPIKMTFDDVKKSAAQLAAKDTSKLKELIEKYGGTNLSSIPKENLGDFAADVMEALG